MAITTEQIKELRNETGISVMQCKKALEEAGGDKAKARVILEKRSKDVADKKSDRTLGAGVIQAYIHAGGSVGAMVELSCETDFVAKNEEFKSLAYDLAMQVSASNPEYLSLEEVPAEAREKAMSVFEKEVQDKPKDMQEKILEAKLEAYFGERTFLNQHFIKDQDKTIADLISAAVQKFGEKIAVTRFARFSTR